MRLQVLKVSLEYQYFNWNKEEMCVFEVEQFDFQTTKKPIESCGFFQFSD